ncbi:hypothetical protein GP486_007869 [Trichoglossum hirsutum]|uniref:Uncharacterized protein n=1 Tax=Trichoglossum hirsutum TaxID=265104 RepID=A0A9P8I5K5_9PEZI|nr:hypothetical protein GP486_007869 [Trichoglossum hirsutum]
MAETVAKIKSTDRQKGGGLSRGPSTGSASPAVDEDDSGDGGETPVPSAEGSLRHSTFRIPLAIVDVDGNGQQDRLWLPQVERPHRASWDGTRRSERMGQLHRVLRRDPSCANPLQTHHHHAQSEDMIGQKLHAGDGPSYDDGSSLVAANIDASSGVRRPLDQIRAETPGAGKERKKGVSFLSRFIGGKKKDPSSDFDEDESELGDRRAEGLDAHIFSQPIGYTPQFPPPPKYIKVRSHNKRVREFDRVFLAQELFRQAMFREGGRPSNVDPSKGAMDAIWAMEFSKDGRYLAAGGQDKIVRVWAVISTSDEREALEKEGEFSSIDSSGYGVRLKAPVFRGKTIRDYQGHAGDVLDLSWSKASLAAEVGGEGKRNSFY